MEQIRVTIRTVIGLIIMTGAGLLVIGVFFFSETEYGMGLFGKIGTVFAPLIGDDRLVNEGAGHLQGKSGGYVPELSYSNGVLQVGDCVEFKSLLSAKLENGTFVNAAIESGFSVYLKDIRTKSGNSVLEMMCTNDLTQMQEIPSAFVYDKALDMLYVFGSGTYVVTVKIYSDVGGVATYEFLLSVEVGEIAK